MEAPPQFIKNEMKAYMKKMYSFHRSVNSYNLVLATLEKVIKNEDSNIMRMRSCFISYFTKKYDNLIIVKGNSKKRIADEVK